MSELKLADIYLLRSLQLLVELVKQSLNGGPVIDVHLVLQQENAAQEAVVSIQEVLQPTRRRAAAAGGRCIMDPTGR